MKKKLCKTDNKYFNRFIFLFRAEVDRKTPVIPIDPKAKFRTLRHSRSATNLASDRRRSSLILGSSSQEIEAQQSAGIGMVRSASGVLVTPPSPTNSKRIPRLPSAEQLRQQYSIEDQRTSPSPSTADISRRHGSIDGFATIHRSFAGKMVDQYTNSSATLPPRPLAQQANRSPTPNKQQPTPSQTKSVSTSQFIILQPPTADKETRKSVTLLKRTKKEQN